MSAAGWFAYAVTGLVTALAFRFDDEDDRTVGSLLTIVALWPLVWVFALLRVRL